MQNDPPVVTGWQEIMWQETMRPVEEVIPSAEAAENFVQVPEAAEEEPEVEVLPLRETRTAPSNREAKDLYLSVWYILLFNLGIVLALFACLLLITIPLGIAIGIASVKIGWRGCKLLFGKE